MSVDLSAREVHFLDHLAPVWREIPPGLRGTIYVGDQAVADRAVALGLVDPVEIGWPRRGVRLDPILVASWGDLRTCSRTRRGVILFEHGAGQTYGTRHHSYLGGRGREAVVLFVVPSARAADLNARHYPRTPNAIVGCPKIDELLKVPAPAGPTTAAVSFHWRCKLTPEGGSAIDDFAPELERARVELRYAGVELIGHAHPRILPEARELYTAAGIETVDTFAEVVARAHLYAVDNSSTLFEFAALGRPVVVLNARAYRRDVDHGLRFWSEADVGLNAEPGELASTIIEAIADRPEVAGSREAAVARTYSVTDGTSALRAAGAIVNLLGGRRGCPVCGAGHASCGGPTDVVAIDQTMKDRDMKKGTKKRYPDPSRKGAFLTLTDDAAKRLGIFGTGVEHRRGAPIPDVTNPGADGIVSSATVPAPAPGPSSPRGALPAGGPTQRARASAEDPEEPAEAATVPTTSRRRRRIDS